MQSEVGFKTPELRRSNVQPLIVPIFPFTFHQVGTIKYISQNTNLPVTTVYAFDKDLDNAAGAPYTLQQIVGVYVNAKM